MLRAGNDVVDLNHNGIIGKSKHTRFVKRVFNENEQSTISSSNDPDLTLWMIWAAKETAYKIISKIIGPPIFAHKKFATSFLNHLPQPKVEVVYKEWLFPVKIIFTQDYIHAYSAHALSSEISQYVLHKKVLQLASAELKDWKNKNNWKDNFTKRERLSVHKAESALIRYHCKKAIAEALNISASRLQIIRPTNAGKMQAPFVLLDNKQAEIDISLSHHGEWLAYCFSIKI